MHHQLLRCRGLAACTLLLAAAPLWAADDTDADRPVTATLGGRLHLDFADFDNDSRGTPNKDDTEIRRAWLDVSGKFFVVDYKLEADFSGDQVEAKDVYVSRDFSGGKLSIGQFKQFFSLDDRTGSNYGSFLERGNAAVPVGRLLAGRQGRHDLGRQRLQPGKHRRMAGEGPCGRRTRHLGAGRHGGRRAAPGPFAGARTL